MYREKSKWTEAQIQYLQENCDKLYDEEIAENLGRSLKSIRRKRQQLGLAKAEGRGKNSLRKEKPKLDKLKYETKIQQIIRTHTKTIDQSPNSPPIG